MRPTDVTSPRLSTRKLNTLTPYSPKKDGKAFAKRHAKVYIVDNSAFFAETSLGQQSNTAQINTPIIINLENNTTIILSRQPTDKKSCNK